MCDTFSLKNLITGINCVKSTNGTSIDVLLTNKSICFHRTTTFQTGLGDCHKIMLTFFKVYFKKIPPKNFEYRNHKSFNENNFLHELDQGLGKGSIYNQKHRQYDVFTNIFRMVLGKHAPIKKKKIVRGNEAPFMTKKLSKAIINRSKLKNKYTKWPSRENILAFKILTKIRKRATFQKLLRME